MKKPTRTILTIILALPVMIPILAGCETAPWVCTPQTCVSVASEDLPAEIRGSWRAADGSTLEVIDYHIDTIDGEVVPKTASILVTEASGDAQQSHITSFDGRVVVGETYLGGELLRRSKSPRLFYRIRVDDGELGLSRLRLDALVAEAVGDDVKIVEFEGANAVVYTDVRAMAAPMVLLLAEPSVWESERVFVRAGTEEAEG